MSLTGADSTFYSTSQQQSRYRFVVIGSRTTGLTSWETRPRGERDGTLEEVEGLRLNKLRLYLGIMVVSSLLSSCTWGYRLGPEWYLHVKNIPEADTPYPPNPEASFVPCIGGLQGKVTLPKAGISSESKQVPVNSEDHKEFLHKSRGGDLIIFEAWCYGEEQVELGYVKRETRIAQTYTYSGGGSLEVYPPIREPSFLCISATETRGEQPPCLSAENADR